MYPFQGRLQTNTMCKQQTPCIGVIAEPVRDSCQKNYQCGFKSILKKNGKIELFFSQFLAQPGYAGQGFMFSRSIVNQDIINIRIVVKNWGNPGFCEKTYLCFREIFAHGSDCRCCYYSISDPVGGTDQYALYLFRMKRFH